MTQLLLSEQKLVQIGIKLNIAFFFSVQFPCLCVYYKCQVVENMYVNMKACVVFETMHKLLFNTQLHWNLKTLKPYMPSNSNLSFELQCEHLWSWTKTA